jgi:hypothetical protein
VPKMKFFTPGIKNYQKKLVLGGVQYFRYGSSGTGTGTLVWFEKLVIGFFNYCMVFQ